MFVTVVMNVIKQSCLKLLDTIESGEIEEFRFERTEEAFSGRVVQTVALSGHTCVSPCFAIILR